MNIVAWEKKMNYFLPKIQTYRAKFFFFDNFQLKAAIIELNELK